MITPGSMPNYRTRVAKKKLSYVRPRRRGKRSREGLAAREAAALLELASASMPAELPAARLRVRGVTAAAVAGSFVAWLRDQARWLRPRAIPAAVALIGLVGLMATTSYIAHMDVQRDAEPAMSAWSTGSRTSGHVPPGAALARNEYRVSHVALINPPR